jgi:hypothetical protein
MLARPEVGTREHILLWLARKPARGRFRWEDLRNCACGQYSREHGAPAGCWLQEPAIYELNGIASGLLGPKWFTKRLTWGRLHRGAREVWGL